MLHPSVRKLLNFALSLLVVALIAENLVLLRQNYRLKTELPLPSALAVHREEPLRDIGGVGFDGRYHTVELPRSGSEHLLVFTFAPRCPECILSKSFDAALSEQAKKQQKCHRHPVFGLLQRFKHIASQGLRTSPTAAAPRSRTCPGL